DLLNRLPTPPEQSFWLGQAAAGNIRVLMPQGVLFQAPTEYFQNLLSQYYLPDLPRLPSTPPDSSRLIPPAGGFGPQAFLNGLLAGGNPADIQTAIIASPEYLAIALNKSFWTGARWLS